MRFPGVGVGDVVLCSQSPDGGDWFPMIITDIPSRNGVPYCVAGIVFCKNQRTIVMEGMDVVYFHEDPVLRDPNVYACVTRDPRQGTFKLTQSAACREVSRGELQELRDALGVTT